MPITDRPQWSLGHGNAVVPSRWQATAGSSSQTTCLSGRTVIPKREGSGSVTLGRIQLRGSAQRPVVTHADTALVWDDHKGARPATDLERPPCLNRPRPHPAPHPRKPARSASPRNPQRHQQWPLPHQQHVAIGWNTAGPGA